MQFGKMVGVLALAALCLALRAGPAQAASETWNGNSSTAWSDTGSWTPNVVPGTGDTATFNGPAGISGGTINLGSGVNVNTLLFDTASAAAYTIGSGSVGSQQLTLDNGGAITVNNTVSNSQTLNANIVLGNDGSTQPFTFTNNGSYVSGGTLGGLNIAGNITGSNGSGVQTLTIMGSGTTVLSGTIGNGTGGGKVALVMAGTGGVLRLGTLPEDGVSTYTGGTMVTGGTLNPSAGGGGRHYPFTFGGSLTMAGGTTFLPDASAGGSVPASWFTVLPADPINLPGGQVTFMVDNSSSGGPSGSYADLVLDSVISGGGAMIGTGYNNDNARRLELVQSNPSWSGGVTLQQMPSFLTNVRLEIMQANSLGTGPLICNLLPGSQGRPGSGDRHFLCRRRSVRRLGGGEQHSAPRSGHEP